MVMMKGAFCVAALCGLLSTTLALSWSCLDVADDRASAKSQCQLGFENGDSACTDRLRVRKMLCGRYGAKTAPCKRGVQLHEMYCGSGATAFRWSQGGSQSQSLIELSQEDHPETADDGGQAIAVNQSNSGKNVSHFGEMIWHPNGKPISVADCKKLGLAMLKKAASTISFNLTTLFTAAQPMTSYPNWAFGGCDEDKRIKCQATGEESVQYHPITKRVREGFVYKTCVRTRTIGLNNKTKVVNGKVCAGEACKDVRDIKIEMYKVIVCKAAGKCGVKKYCRVYSGGLDGAGQPRVPQNWWGSTSCMAF